MATYGAVLLAEVVGDKLLYSTAVLATRYRPKPVALGAIAAFAAKMGVAVLVGNIVSRLPVLLLAGITAASFSSLAFMLWRSPAVAPDTSEVGAPKAALLSFAAVFLSEWADIGQLTAASMTARFGAPAVVWLGATSAMMTKGALAVSVGAGVRRWLSGHVPARAVRRCGAALFLLLGVLSVIELLSAATSPGLASAAEAPTAHAVGHR